VFEHLPCQSQKVQASLKLLLETLEQQIQELEQAIYQKIKEHDEKLLENLISIPGIGPDLRCSGWAGPNGYCSDCAGQRDRLLLQSPTANFLYRLVAENLPIGHFE
jgi:hypothetical protein